MTRQELVEIARKKDIRIRNMLSENIIHRIQQKEGCDVCFATDKAGHCDHKDCLWRQDCLARLTCFGSDMASQCDNKNCLWYPKCLRLYHLNHNQMAPIISAWAMPMDNA